MKKGLDYTGVTIVFACHDGEGNFLFSKRSKNCRDEHGCWCPGGGGLEFGDSVIDTLQKEIEEEYCAEVLEQEFLGYRDVHRVQGGKPTHWVALDFKVKIDREEVRNGEPHKFEELKWFRLDELPENMHSQWNVFYKQHKEKLR